MLVLIGSDRREIFRESLTPAFAVFHGDELENVALDEEEMARLKPGLAVAQWAHTPEQTALYPAAPALGRHLIDALVDDGFDVAAMKKLPRGPYGRSGIPRAFGFLYRRILEDAPIPAVPVVLNTLYPPNRPRAARCVELGRALARGLESFPEDVRVAVLASGGLSHYVIDEDFDRGVLGAIESGDLDRLGELPEDRFSLRHVGDEELAGRRGGPLGVGAPHAPRRLRSLLSVGGGNRRSDGFRDLDLRTRAPR